METKVHTIIIAIVGICFADGCAEQRFEIVSSTIAGFDRRPNKSQQLRRLNSTIGIRYPSNHRSIDFEINKFDVEAHRCLFFDFRIRRRTQKCD